MTKPSTIKIDDVEYVRSDAVKAPIVGNRHVIVVDRGWIFAGDIERKDGRIKLTRALHVLRWESIGFHGMIANPKSNKVTINPISDVDLPQDSELFAIPVNEDWGI